MDLNTAISGNGQLLPQNFKLTPPDDSTSNMYAIGQGDDPNGRSLISSLKGAHAVWHAGMGKLDPSQLGQPLPGTVAPPGSNLPPGIVDYLPDQLPWGPPVPPPPAPPVQPEG
jgi:hypothetical protein